MTYYKIHWKQPEFIESDMPYCLQRDLLGFMWEPKIVIMDKISGKIPSRRVAIELAEEMKEHFKQVKLYKHAITTERVEI